MLMQADIAAVDDDEPGYEAGVTDGRREALQEAAAAWRSGDLDELRALFGEAPTSSHVYEISDAMAEVQRDRLARIRKQTKAILETMPL